MNAKHTKGPWRELVTRIDDARGYQICHLDLHGKSEAERDANRRLIAAAPIGYDLAAEVMRLCNVGVMVPESVAKLAAEFIAKAKGEA